MNKSNKVILLIWFILSVIILSLNFKMFIMVRQSKSFIKKEQEKKYLNNVK